MTQNKKVIGITGGSGCGKSYLSGLLRERGIPVIDADIVAREVMQKGQPCLLEAAECFGSEILSDGELNRKKLAEIVFSDEKMLKKLNEITHKYILASIYNKIEKEESEIVCVDGAVLIESGIKCDMLVGVLADKAVRKKRIMLRDGLSDGEAEARINAQQEDGFYLENCDFVIYNNGDTFDIDSILKRIEE
ncbi:MAG: dephospho-CoA kinase [Clostridia bacterium]|nr:dephospho-CoA kinase [Clostridia bacterium]